MIPKNPQITSIQIPLLPLNEQFSSGSEGDVETQPSSNENQSTSEVQRPTVTSSSSNDDSNPPTQPNEGREIKDSPLIRPTAEPTTATEPVTSSSSDSVSVTSSSDSLPLVQPPTSTSSSDSVPLVQAPVSTSSSDSVPLIQSPITSSASDTITLEPVNKEPEPVIPEIDEMIKEGSYFLMIHKLYLKKRNL